MASNRENHVMDYYYRYRRFVANCNETEKTDFGIAVLIYLREEEENQPFYLNQICGVYDEKDPSDPSEFMKKKFEVKDYGKDTYRYVM